jgi:hypothetical protein
MNQWQLCLAVCRSGLISRKESISGHGKVMFYESICSGPNYTDHFPQGYVYFWEPVCLSGFKPCGTICLTTSETEYFLMTIAVFSFML